ncbi:NDR1/HIN1-like protein 10 [Cardamine amara subsp. amara]|uniref:NDR1/HIN1-like protein 10 n=1 Tax=Cardamine amara subsp. amara TaxID=228776 RepID=A0ABD0ZKT2_CARAN
MSNLLPLPSPPQSQLQPEPPETPPWDTPSSKWFTPINTPSSKWFTPINTPWRTTPRSTQSTPTPVALTEVIVSKSPLSQTSPATTPKLDGTDAKPLNEKMIHLRLRTTRTNPWIWCGAALCFIFSILLIVFGIATLILFLAVRPRTPVFDISNAKLNTIYFESPVYFNGDMLLLVNFTNPNKKLNVRFENLSVQLWFSDKMIATQGVLPFSQRNGRTRLEPIRLISNLVFLPVNHAVELKRQVMSNKIDYEIRSTFKVKAVLGIIHYSYWLHGSCQLQLTSPPSGGLVYRNCTTKRW